ncbi:MAG: hypothetical protein ACRENG_02945, partial [bacterium]
ILANSQERFSGRSFTGFMAAGESEGIVGEAFKNYGGDKLKNGRVACIKIICHFSTAAPLASTI